METIELSISGMNCGACQNHVTRALEQVAGIASVAVNLNAATATVRGDDVQHAALVAAVEAEGYGAQLLAVSQGR